ncbi:Trp biosynthesis-associated membrane protein [Spirillospora albida]|uniref:Trp biosynthesis-associated membrane protein n=1 Tax=Spirillospora albida TaxID=58123 RepID=UPI00068ECD6A|nr:Trp biosynthesis-associated membrane protein [Spirillospora albida]
MTPGRERGLTALLCAAGAGLALLAAGREWARVQASGAITPYAERLTGHDLGGAGAALGWAGLAGLAALFATRGRVRAAVGALLAVFGAGIVYASATSVQRAHVLAAAEEKSSLLKFGAQPVLSVNLWWMASVTGGVLLVVAGLVTLVRGTRWPGMSSRYERDASRSGTAAPPAPDDPAALWKSLDRGEDPTASGVPDPSAPPSGARDGA